MSTFTLSVTEMLLLCYFTSTTDKRRASVKGTTASSFLEQFNSSHPAAQLCHFAFPSFSFLPILSTQYSQLLPQKSFIPPVKIHNNSTLIYVLDGHNNCVSSLCYPLISEVQPFSLALPFCSDSGGMRFRTRVLRGNSLRENE